VNPFRHFRDWREERKGKRVQPKGEVLAGGSASDVKELPKELLWLADAPLFIDEKQVDAFYDAVLQPDYEEIGRNFARSVSANTTIGTRLTVGAVFPPLVKAEGEASLGQERGSGEESGSNWNRVANPYRRLLGLVLRYATEPSLRSRLLFVDGDRCVDADGTAVDLAASDFPRRSPRAMVMLEVPPDTKFIPAALEMEGTGSVVPVYKTFAQRLEAKDGTPSQPEYKSGSDAGSKTARYEYWNWFVDHYDRQIALEVVEEAVQKGEISWIAYRIPLQGEFVHLHLAGRGRYDTGTFGYQLVARGNRHGLRIIGRLKPEPDINVLAAFEN